MNKRINFEDTIFILNVRIRLIRDLLHLDTDANLFYTQTVGDLEFINSILDMLTVKFMENMKIIDRETEADNISDAEWQFSQLLNELSGNSNPFPSDQFPDMQFLISKLRKDSVKRQKHLEESYVPAEQSSTEPVVTNAELNGLLGSE